MRAGSRPAPKSFGLGDQAGIAVVREISAWLGPSTPGSHHLHDQPDCQRGEHAVRPHPLRTPTGGTIFAGLFCQRRVSNDSHTAQARADGLRQHHLARNQVAMPSAQLVNVHIHGVGLSERVVGKAMAV